MTGHHNQAAENVLGTMGTICWTIQLVPQIWKSYHEKSTKGLSQILVLLWSLSAIPLGIYAILQNLNIPLIVQPQLFSTLCLLSWVQCQYYTHQRRLWVCVLIYLSILGVIGGLQAGLVFAIKPSYDQGQHAPALAFGILASVMIAAALIPQYYEIYRYKEVIGISIPFIFIDLMGGVFNVLSLVFKTKFDIVAGVCYSLVVVMDGAVILLALILNPLAARRRRRAAEAIAGSPAEAQTVTPSSGISTAECSSLAEKV